MNAFRSCALMVVGGSFLLAACDEQASQQIAAGRNLDDAVRLMEQAHLGYVPGEQDEQAARDVQAFRQATLDRAIKPLEDAIDRGSATQAAQAAVLRSDIASSHAMHLTGQAVEAGSDLLGETVALFDTASKLVSHQAQRRMLERDLGQVADRYSSARADKREEVRAQRQRREELQSELDEVRAAAEEARERAEQLLQRAAEAEEKAFVADGEARHDLEDAAAGYRREAAQFTATAEKREVRLGVLASRIERVDRRIEALTGASETLRQRGGVTEEQQVELASQREEKRERIDELVAQLTSEVAELQALFEQDVSTPLSDAADAVASVIDTLDQVAQNQQITDEQEARLQMTLFARRLDLAHVLSQHAGVTLSFASALDHVSQSSDRVDFAQGVSELESLHTQLVEATRNAAAAARELADDIERTNAFSAIAEDAEVRSEMQNALERRLRALDSYLTHATFTDS